MINNYCLIYRVDSMTMDSLSKTCPNVGFLCETREFSCMGNFRRGSKEFLRSGELLNHVRFTFHFGRFEFVVS